MYYNIYIYIYVHILYLSLSLYIYIYIYTCIIHIYIYNTLAPSAHCSDRADSRTLRVENAPGVCGPPGNCDNNNNHINQ